MSGYTLSKTLCTTAGVPIRAGVHARVRSSAPVPTPTRTLGYDNVEPEHELDKIINYPAGIGLERCVKTA